MVDKFIEIHQSMVIEDDNSISITEFCRCLSLSENSVVDYIEHAVITPSGTQVSNWQFDSQCLSRARKAKHIAYDLGVNSSGLAVILDLLERIEHLESQHNPDA